jgi:DNA-binding transcriptional regulator YiaG
MYQISSSTTLSQMGSTPARTAFVLMTTLLAGTGTVYSLDHIDLWRTHLQPRVSFELEGNESATQDLIKPDVRSITEHIENIRSILNPTVSDLANLLDISRQAVYKWLTGDSSPEADNKEQIVALSKIADAFKDANISRADSMLKMKAFDGKSLLDMLKSGQSCDQYVQALIAESRKIEKSYNQSGLATSKTKPNNNWLSSVSIPGSTEQS